MRKVPALLSIIVLAVAIAHSAELVNVDKAGLALQGYDPVAFFVEGKAIPGNPAITASHQGAIYRFSSEQHREAFGKDPNRFAPAFGGFCAYAVSRNQTAPVEIGTWQILHDRLVLNYDAKVRTLFDAEREENLKKADMNWPSLMVKGVK